MWICCFRYHKGTDFQANHNCRFCTLFQPLVVLDTTKVQIFKQITTTHPRTCRHVLLFQIPQRYRFSSKSQQAEVSETHRIGCFRYHKGTDFQANHNLLGEAKKFLRVVLDTTKVQIFKQITTTLQQLGNFNALFQIPQRYRFSSKSQRQLIDTHGVKVVLDTTKVQIFKQITTYVQTYVSFPRLFQIPQRYRFSSKSQPSKVGISASACCFRYHKGTDFQANHNLSLPCS